MLHCSCGIVLGHKCLTELLLSPALYPGEVCVPLYFLFKKLGDLDSHCATDFPTSHICFSSCDFHRFVQVAILVAETIDLIRRKALGSSLEVQHCVLDPAHQ